MMPQSDDKIQHKISASPEGEARGNHPPGQRRLAAVSRSQELQSRGFRGAVAKAEKTVPQLPRPFRIPDLEKAMGPFCSPRLISGRNSGIINTADEESIMSEVTEMNGDFENSELFNQLPEELKEFFDQLPDETKEKLRNCKSEEEVMEVLNEDMVPIPDDALDTVAGGWEYCNHSCARYRTDDWGDED